MAVGRLGCKSGALVERVRARPLAVETAGGEEDEARNAGQLGLLREPRGGDLVDVVRRLRIQVADRVIADGGEVQDGVEALEVGDLDVAYVLADGLDLSRLRPEDARGEQIRVESDDLVAGPLGERDQDGADVAVVAGDKNAQGTS